jgi:hypothetical protein
MEPIGAKSFITCDPGCNATDTYVTTRLTNTTKELIAKKINFPRPVLLEKW